MPQNVFLNGEYLRMRPAWHVDDSVWKAKAILDMLRENRLAPSTIGEVGCGTGEVLRQLQSKMSSDRMFIGYDISPQAIELSKMRQNSHLHFKLADLCADGDARFDLLLVLDVLEHQENYFSFLRDIKGHAPYKLFHTVLDLSAHTVLFRGALAMRRRQYADLHYFTKDVMLQALMEEGYEIVDWRYAPRSMYRASGVFGKMRQLPRRVCFALHHDFAVRLLGGYSLLVLAK